MTQCEEIQFGKMKMFSIDIKRPIERIHCSTHL